MNKLAFTSARSIRPDSRSGIIVPRLSRVAPRRPLVCTWIWDPATGRLECRWSFAEKDQQEPHPSPCIHATRPERDDAVQCLPLAA